METPPPPSNLLIADDHDNGDDNGDDDCAIDDTPSEHLQPSLAESKRLIRAATTFLSILNPRPGQPSRLLTSDPDHNTISNLNCIATLFVSKAKADVAAVAISQRNSGVQAVTVVEVDQILATKNSARKSQKLITPTISPVSPHKRFGLDWLKPFLKAGPMTPANHAYQLETLCNIYVGATRDEKEGVLTGLKNFIFLQCQPKIQQRLTIPLHPSCREQFLGLFRPGAITSDMLRNNFLPNPQFEQVRKRKSEKKFLPLMKEITGYTFYVDNRDRVALNEVSIFHYHKFVCFLINELNDHVSVLANYRDTKKNKDVGFLEAEKCAKESLEIIDQRMCVLGDLLHRSESFHTYIYQPPIAHFLKEASNQLSASMPQDIRDILEDEGVLFSRRATDDNPIGCFSKWLGLVVQWAEAAVTLAKPLKKPISIVFLSSPAASDANMQLPLDNLLCFVLDGRHSLSRVKKAIQVKAVSMTASTGDQGWGQLTNENWNMWEESFTGKFHCEALLAFLKTLEYNKVDELIESTYKTNFKSLLDKFKTTTNMLGVSKGCCWMCQAYIRYIQPDLKVQGTTGKIFPWSLPELELDGVVVEKLLDDLKQLVWQAMKDLGVLAIDQRLSGSDMGQDDDLYSGSALKRYSGSALKR